LGERRWWVSSRLDGMDTDQIIGAHVKIAGDDLAAVATTISRKAGSLAQGKGRGKE